MFRSEASHVPKAYILGTRICADLSLRPTGEELKKILLLACCYQEACARSSFFSKLSRPALALSTTGVTRSSASRITRSAWSAISRCLKHHNGTRKECGEHRLAVARRYTPLCLAPVVEGGDLRSRNSPAGKSFVKEPDRRAIPIRGQNPEAPQSVPAPGPVPDGLETPRRLVFGVTAAARQSGLQRRRRLVVDVPPALNPDLDRIRQHLREALHLGRGIGRVDEASAADDGLESGHEGASSERQRYIASGRQRPNLL